MYSSTIEVHLINKNSARLYSRHIRHVTVSSPSVWSFSKHNQRTDSWCLTCRHTSSSCISQPRISITSPSHRVAIFSSSICCIICTVSPCKSLPTKSLISWIEVSRSNNTNLRSTSRRLWSRSCVGRSLHSFLGSSFSCLSICFFFC